MLKGKRILLIEVEDKKVKGISYISGDRGKSWHKRVKGKIR